MHVMRFISASMIGTACAAVPTTALFLFFSDAPQKVIARLALSKFGGWYYIRD
jgi:hypothetical protein